MDADIMHQTPEWPSPHYHVKLVFGYTGSVERMEMALEKPENQAAQTVSEEELVRRAQQRDTDAWAVLYNDHVERIYRYILARVRNTMVAEDLTEQVFMKALGSISSFTWKGGPFIAWLFRIAHNLIVDFHRKPSTREKPLVDWDLPLSESDPVKVAETNITLDIVLQEIDKLSPGQRQAIELRFIADLSVEETARLMGKKPGAVRTLQHSAVESLRRRLAQRGENG